MLLYITVDVMDSGHDLDFTEVERILYCAMCTRFDLKPTKAERDQKRKYLLQV